MTAPAPSPANRGGVSRRRHAERRIGLGDFQTPPALAAEILRWLHARGIAPARILEPTCGRGAFLTAAYDTWGAIDESVGVELHPAYGRELAALASRRASLRIVAADAQTFDFAGIGWRTSGPLLICGNLPWVTTDALRRLAHGYQQRIRDNPTALKGLAARTGAAAFDISERLTLRLIGVAAAQPRADIALLLKESVARRILLAARDVPTDAAIVRIDARRWFGVGAAACVLHLRFQAAGRRGITQVAVHADVRSPARERWTVAGALVRRRTGPREDAGSSDLRWRHGIKHDAQSVFAFTACAAPDPECALVRNGAGRTLPRASRYLFPFVSARALQREDDLAGTRTSLLVPQRSLGDRSIETDAGAVLERAYLADAEPRLSQRRSSIYRGGAPYAIFGVGPYAFAPYKVGVAALYLVPRFRFVGTIDGRPCVVGDTAYTFACDDPIDAAVIAALGNGAEIRRQLREMAFPGKRPITKAILDALDWYAAYRDVDVIALVDAATRELDGWRGDPLPPFTRATVEARAAVLFRDRRRRSASTATP